MLMSSDAMIRKQHEAVRNTAGWYYFTHQLIEVTGAGSIAAMDNMCSAAIGKLAHGRERYTTILDKNGIIQDDVIVFRLEEEKFWISTLHRARELSRLAEYAKSGDVAFADITDQWDMFSVQGPNSLAFVNAIVANPVDELKFFSITDNEVDGVTAKVARSGYTGEKFGYEIYVPSQHKEMLEKKLRDNQDRFNALEVDEIDVICFTLAAEKGLVLMSDIHGCNPFEVGMDRFVDFSKKFEGSRALKRLKKLPCKRELVSFILDDDEALVYGGPKGARVMKNGVDVGRATKMTYGVTIGKNIGYALIDTDKAKIGDEVTLNGYRAVLAERPLLK